LDDRISIAAVNGPASVVVSGDEETVLRVAAAFAGQGRRASRLKVSHAFHYPAMEPSLDDFPRVAKSRAFEPPRLPLISGVTGEPATEEQVCAPEERVAALR